MRDSEDSRQAKQFLVNPRTEWNPSFRPPDPNAGITHPLQVQVISVKGEGGKTAEPGYVTAEANNVSEGFVEALRVLFRKHLRGKEPPSIVRFPEPPEENMPTDTVYDRVFITMRPEVKEELIRNLLGKGKGDFGGRLSGY